MLSVLSLCLSRACLGKNAHVYLVQNGIAKEMRLITSHGSFGVPAINRPRQPVLRRLRAPEPPHLPAGRTRHCVFECCFTYVCPEPVLVKCSLINVITKMAHKGRFRSPAHPRALRCFDAGRELREVPPPRPPLLPRLQKTPPSYCFRMFDPSLSWSNQHLSRIESRIERLKTALCFCTWKQCTRHRNCRLSRISAPSSRQNSIVCCLRPITTSPRVRISA
jgi:hypothetical protein